MTEGLTFWGLTETQRQARLVRLTQTNHCESNDALFLTLGLEGRGQAGAVCRYAADYAHSR